MNAIEQMMQAQGANTAQSMAALLGGTSAGSVSTGFAEQFAAALQNTGETSPFAQAISDGSISIYAVTNVSGTQSGANTSPQQGATQLSLDGTEIPEAVAAQLPAEGYQLVKITPENFTTLFGNSATVTAQGNISTESTTGAIGTDTASTPFLIVQTPDGNTQSGVHLLPVAELEALLASSSLGQPVTPASTAAVSADGVAANTATTTAATTTSTVPATAAAQTAAATVTTPADTSVTVDPTTKTTVDQQQSNATAKPEASLNNETAKSLAERAGETAAAKSVKEQPAANSIKAQKAAEADAHGLQTQQQAANATKKPSTTNTTATAQQNTGTSTTATSSTQSASNGQSGNQSGGEQSGGQNQQNSDPRNAAQPQARRVDIAANAPLAHNTAVQAPVTWTPESLSGFGDGFSADTFSGGLSGLRGESSFLGSMGILGGKASPHMGGQIAKQLNLQVTNAVKNGSSEFTMRLDPAELGRVQVKMQFGADGKVAAQVMVERPETLELLQREVRGLERAIESGGHKADNAGISFSLDTNDGESAGKAFAEAMHQDRLKEQLEQNGEGNTAGNTDDLQANEETDSAVLEEILSRVTPETGLDVRI